MYQPYSNRQPVGTNLHIEVHGRINRTTHNGPRIDDISGK